MDPISDMNLIVDTRIKKEGQNFMVEEYDKKKFINDKLKAKLGLMRQNALKLPRKGQTLNQLIN